MGKFSEALRNFSLLILQILTGRHSSYSGKHFFTSKIILILHTTLQLIFLIKIHFFIHFFLIKFYFGNFSEALRNFPFYFQEIFLRPSGIFPPKFFSVFWIFSSCWTAYLLQKRVFNDPVFPHFYIFLLLKFIFYFKIMKNLHDIVANFSH